MYRASIPIPITSYLGVRLSEPIPTRPQVLERVLTATSLAELLADEV